MTDVISKARGARAGRAKAMLKRAGYEDGGSIKLSGEDLDEIEEAGRTGTRTGHPRLPPAFAGAEAYVRSRDKGASFKAASDADEVFRDREQKKMEDATGAGEVERTEARKAPYGSGGKVRKLGRRHAKKARG